MENILSTFANWLAEKTSKKYNFTMEEKICYIYGLQIVLYNFLSIIILLSFSLLLHCFTRTLIVMLAFGSLRIVSGGIHLKTCSKVSA